MPENCCENLETVLAACKAGRKVAKGLTGTLYIACKDDVDTIPAATAMVIADDIEMVATKKFYAQHFDKVGSSFKTETQGEGETKSYKTTVTYFIAGIAPEVSNVYNSTVRGEFMAIVPDKMGNKRLVGDIDYGCEISIIEQTDDKPGMAITISWTDHPDLCLYYNGVITL
ncbi:MAG TPA: hypothetical protein VFG10_18935 [Saprospiraceae bacterium]|nr:hypothetical protein [Saprospiraceae bacterium]